MSDALDSTFGPIIEKLRTAPTAPGALFIAFGIQSNLLHGPDAKAAADSLAREVAKTGLQSLECVSLVLTGSILEPNSAYTETRM
jgi:elongation factor 3